MARKSRKANALTPEQSAPVTAPERRIYNAGCYARLSVEDSGRPGADTIQMQETLLREFVESQPDMRFYDMYSDNGKTGTNFDRPAFERMMNDVREGKIDCIVVKDLSRFGRNYKETGNYLFRVFPFLGVRFVAVNDNFDTLTAARDGDYYTVPLKNLLNDVYSRDLSRKSSSALQIKQQKGEFIGTWAPYGYRKRADDRHKLEPEEETAPTVRNIFRMRAEGMSYQMIARALNNDGILSPAAYLYQKGYVKAELYARSVWSSVSVKKILADEVYLGHMVQGRKRTGFADGAKQRILPKSEWTVVRDTHEPLIDLETFEAVQLMAQEKAALYKERLGKYDHLGGSANMFKGLIYCADCGCPLVRYKFVNDKGRKRTRPQTVQYYFICRTHSQNPASCPNKYIREDDLKELLWDTIRREIALSDSMEKLAEEYSRSCGAVRREQALRRDIADAKKAYDKASMLYESLYPNYIDRVITEQDYLRLKEHYRNDMEQAKARMETAERLLNDFRKETTENGWIAAFQRFRDETELTESMAHALVERVDVDAENRLTVTLRYRDEFMALVRSLEAGKAGAV